MSNIKDYFTLDFYRLKRIQKLVDEINGLADEMGSLSDSELKHKTVEFRKRLKKGESLDSLLPEAYAVVREADKRVLGKFPYDVQVMGAIVLHQGNLAEMKTGEGKTLTATMPLYLNGLTGDGAILVTTNAYLACRDAEEMRPVYTFLGLTVGIGVREDEKKIEIPEKKRIYASDIIYTTNSVLGFDYLIDNLAPNKSKKYMRELNYVIVDEADSVLLDSAQTPLVISGAPRVQSNLYDISNQFVSTLVEGDDYYVNLEQKEVWLKQEGMDAAESFFALHDIYDVTHFELVRHVNLALKAHTLFTLGKEYVVENGKVQLLDQTNGRILESTKLQGGQHQAIEAKEMVKLSPEMRAMASITYQNLFLLFRKIAGMTGTGKPAEEEFIEIYNMEVIRIPTNKPVQRKDLPDKIFTTLPEKVNACVQEIKRIHRTGQPILVVSGSVRMSELFSEILLMEGIPHSLLNAYNAAKEAQMIAEAGRLHAVTVATNMAGRGTDIKLAEGVRELGGLAVIGTERMLNERMDLQMRGRSGRQGDPGFSEFYVSLEDELLTQYGASWIEQYFKKHRDSIDEYRPKELRQRRFKAAITKAQAASESSGKESRTTIVQYDESVKIQRNFIYQERNRVLNGSSEGFDVQQIIEDALTDFIDSQDELTPFMVERYIFDHLSYEFTDFPDDFDATDKEAVKAYLWELITKEQERKESLITKDFETFRQTAVLKAIDESWIEEVDYLQQLRIVVQGRQSAQRNPVYEYHSEAIQSYQRMKKDIRNLALQYLMLSDVSYNKKNKLEIHFV
ncbi:accessory Sec system translocase SecA2 [Streptococcus jiangjianxini]|uniref:accessory Sec system translocase SecA2 n=1 Tax=Streptococcus jiangjianxini TaxID=3161189 RepID=UPI0032EB8FDE